MQSEFRQRAFLPMMIPVAIVGTIALVVGLFAVILLYLPQDVGNIVAITAAAGILGGGALAASQESLDPLKKVGVGLAVGVPVVFGGVVAAGTDICEQTACPADFQPILRVPPGVPVIVSSQPAAFDIETVTLPAAPYLDEFPEDLSLAFDNVSNISHNLIVTGGQDREAEVLMSSDGEPAATDTYTAGVESVFFLPPEPGEYLFFCSIHEGMDGTLIIEEGADPAIDGDPLPDA